MCYLTELAGTAQRFGMALPAPVLASLKQDLFAELASVTLYADARRALIALHETGIQIAVCSNLAAPYAIPVLELLPFGLDRSEERRVGKECVRTCRSRGSPYP